VDLIVLLIGFVPRPGMREISQTLGLATGTDGFLVTADEHVCDNITNIPGVFLAGAVKGPSSIVNAVADAKAAAVEAYKYLTSE
jgi:heterodisulfide reductase subunit A